MQNYNSIYKNGHEVNQPLGCPVVTPSSVAASVKSNVEMLTITEELMKQVFQSEETFSGAGTHSSRSAAMALGSDSFSCLHWYHLLKLLLASAIFETREEPGYPHADSLSVSRSLTHTRTHAQQLVHPMRK